jgi:sec-independent protein translocase protein TatA
MLTGWERPSHWLVLAVVVLVLFGYKKLPDVTRSVGRSLRIFKTEMKGLSDDDATRDSATSASQSAPSASASEPPVVPPQAPVVPPMPPVAPHDAVPVPPASEATTGQVGDNTPPKQSQPHTG